MARDPEYLPDRLFLDDETVAWIAEHLETPLYVYDAAGIRQTAQELKAAFAWNPGYRQFFPVKTLPTRAILQLLLSEGFGLLCSTEMELEAAKRAGASGAQLLFVATFPREKDIAAACASGATVILDSPEVLRRFLACGPLPKHIGLRFCPNERINVGTHVAARAEGYKSGMDLTDLIYCAKRLREQGVTEIGLHCHMTDNLNLEAYWAKLAELLAGCWKQIEKKTHLQLSFLNLGGGLSIPTPESEHVPNLARIAQRVQEKLVQLGMETVPVHTTFGRYLTGPHGLLLLRANYYKETCLPRAVIGVDGSSGNLLRALTRKTYYHISVAGRRETEHRQMASVGGILNQKTDLLGVRRILPVPERGELVAVHGAGAYAAAFQPLFCGDLPAEEYLFEDGALRLIRRRLDPESYFSTEI